jgi:phenylacetate-CoA ligase
MTENMQTRTATRHYSPLEAMAPEELQAKQLHLLRRQLRRLQNNGLFGLSLAKVDIDRIRSIEDFRRMIPVSRKADLIADQNAAPPYGKRLGIPSDDIVYVVTSGGTSGQGRETHALTSFDTQLVSLCFQWGWHWAGMDSRSIVANTFGVAMTSAGVWMHGALERLGANHLRLGKYDTAAKCALIEEHRPDFLIATPSYLRTLETELMRRGNILSHLGVRTILMTAETFTVDWAAEREALWNAKLYEWYGTSQKFLAFSCEHGCLHNGNHGVLHTMPTIWLLEVVDPDTGEHVREGEFGEVVATHLLAEAGPSLRYATGDRARFLGWTAPGRRSFPAIESGTISRLDDMMKIRALNVWPWQFDAALFIDGVKDYRGEVFLDDRNKEQIVITLELDEGAHWSPQQTANLGDRVRDYTGLRVDFTFAAERLGEFVDEGSKARRWKDLRNAPPNSQINRGEHATRAEHARASEQ